LRQGREFARGDVENNAEGRIFAGRVNIMYKKGGLRLHEKHENRAVMGERKAGKGIWRKLCS